MFNSSTSTVCMEIQKISHFCSHILAFACMFAERGPLLWIHLGWELAAFVLLSPDTSFRLLEVQFLYYNQ